MFPKYLIISNISNCRITEGSLIAIFNNPCKHVSRRLAVNKVNCSATRIISDVHLFSKSTC